LIAIILIIVYFGLKTEHFLELDNFLDIFRAVSILVIVSIGFTMSVVVNGLDVSVGAVTGLAVILTPAIMVIWRLEWYVAVVLALVAGAISAAQLVLDRQIRIPDCWRIGRNVPGDGTSDDHHPGRLSLSA
jgi:simple sugar transport system permease protein